MKAIGGNPARKSLNSVTEISDGLWHAICAQRSHGQELCVAGTNRSLRNTPI
jgi:hypothetical protein